MDAIKSVNVNSKIVSLIPREMAYKHVIVPIRLEGDKLHVAMSNPEDSVAIRYIKFLYKKDVEVHVMEEEDIIKILSMYYGEKKINDSVEKLIDKSREEESQESIEDFSKSPAARLVEYIMDEAINNNCSDIHIEPQKNDVILRFRKDGTLFQFMKIPKSAFSSICIRIKLLASMNITEKRIPQDGKMTITINNNNYDIRVSSLPTVHGEKIVMRILYRNKDFIKLKNIGFSKEKILLVQRMINTSHGMFLITGPTGSGKSTTLYAMLNEINKGDINITTIEDPVEYSVPGINQVNVNPKAGITFASGLRSMLRQDPDVIMIGEIRDEETAEIAVRASITGHKVFSTLHTNDALGAINRLTEMGIKKYILVDALRGIVAQRLCRKVCNYCREEYIATKREKDILGIEKDFKLSRGRGCSFCNYTGYDGRTLASEVVEINQNLREEMLRSENMNELRKRLLEQGNENLTSSFKELLFKGIISFEEFMTFFYTGDSFIA